MKDEITLRKTPSQQRSKATVDAIKSAAAGLFEAQGIDNISMTHIASEAGMSKPALYRYFPNKQSLIRSMAEDALAYYRDEIQAKLDWQSLSPAQLMRQGLEAYCAIHLREPYRIQLRAAINADPELSRLDFEDSKANAKVIAQMVNEANPGVSMEDATRRSLLIIELSDSLLRLLARSGVSDRQALLEEFVQRFSSDL